MRTGRPQTTEPKNIRYSIRLDRTTEANLASYCAEYGITKGEAIRQGIELLLTRAN